MTVIDWIVTRKCNLNCYYCLQGTDTRQEPCKPIDTSFLAMADAEKYSFHLTGGEPMLVPNIGEICARVVATSNLLSLNTNLTIDPSCIIESVRPEDLAFINASVHFPYRSKSMTNYVRHYEMLRNNCYFIVGSCVIQPDSFDDIVAFIDDVRNKYGIMIFPKLMRGICDKKSYPDAYSEKQISEMLRLSEIAYDEAYNFNPHGLEHLSLHSPSIDSWNKDIFTVGLSSYCFDGIQAIHLDTNGDWIKCENNRIGNVYSDGFRPLSDLKSCNYSINSGHKTYCSRPNERNTYTYNNI